VPNVHGPSPWLVAVLSLVLGGAWLRREGRRFFLVWEAETSRLLPAPGR